MLDPYLQDEESPPIQMNCIYTILHKVRPGSSFDCVYLFKNISEHASNIQSKPLQSISPILNPTDHDRVSLTKATLKGKIFGSMFEPNY